MPEAKLLHHARCLDLPEDAGFLEHMKLDLCLRSKAQRPVSAWGTLKSSYSLRIPFPPGSAFQLYLNFSKLPVTF